MLKSEQNEFITRTGPDTPMGNLFRCYWIPALLASELSEPECPPVRVKILSERLLAFRDSEGRLGLIDEFCAHRGVSLWFGRNEDCGLRCPYHGWKYDVNGQCVDVPSEAVESGYARKIKLKSYPLVERGGILWTYMGPADRQPELPEFEFAIVPDSQRFVSKRLQETNWLQGMEGGIDSSHSSWLHRGDFGHDPLLKGAGGNKYNFNDLAPVFEVVESPGGLFIGARRKAENDNYYWRITPWIMPSYTAVPPRGDHPMHGHFWIPIDDETCWVWSYDYHPSRELTHAEIEAMRQGLGIHVKYIPGTFMPLANKHNNYMMDRVAQREGRYFSGIEGVAMQDASLQESMGAVCDRTKENLVGTDNGIIMARHRLMRAAKQLAEKGTQPPGVEPQHQRIRSAALLLPKDAPFQEGAKEALIAVLGQPQVTV